MLKVGMTGYVTSGHARRIAAIINGFAREPSETEQRGLGQKDPEVAELMRLEKLWPPLGVEGRYPLYGAPFLRDDPRQVAADFGIPEVSESFEEFIQGLDGVLIITGTEVNHQKYAPRFLRAGIPVYVDKPLSLSPLEAEALIEVAQKTGTPFMSTAASRFSSKVAAIKADLPKLGKVLTATAVSPCWWGMTFYGCHGLDMLFEVVGWDVVEVFNVGDINRNIVRLTYRNGMNCVLQTFIPQLLRALLVIGTEGFRYMEMTEMSDFQDFFGRMLLAIARLFQTGEAYVSLEEQLRAIQVLTAAERSAIVQRPVRVVP